MLISSILSILNKRTPCFIPKVYPILQIYKVYQGIGMSISSRFYMSNLVTMTTRSTPPVLERHISSYCFFLIQIINNFYSKTKQEIKVKTVKNNYVSVVLKKNKCLVLPVGRSIGFVGIGVVPYGGKVRPKKYYNNYI